MIIDIFLFQVSEGFFTPTKRFFLDVILWFFEEAVPIALDAPALLAKGDIATYTDVLQRLLPIFIRLQKKNYVALTAYILCAIPALEKRPDCYAAFIANLTNLSSEALEVFHSLLRATSQYQDPHTRLARKALMITARESSGIS